MIIIIIIIIIKLDWNFNDVGLKLAVAFEASSPVGLGAANIMIPEPGWPLQGALFRLLHPEAPGGNDGAMMIMGPKGALIMGPKGAHDDDDDDDDDDDQNLNFPSLFRTWKTLNLIISINFHLHGVGWGRTF